MPDLRDKGLLSSVLGRPMNKLAYGGPGQGLFDLATAYAFGLAANHPFNDGNKRTSWVYCVLFLRRNDVRLAVLQEMWCGKWCCWHRAGWTRWDLRRGCAGCVS